LVAPSDLGHPPGQMLPPNSRLDSLVEGGKRIPTGPRLSVSPFVLLFVLDLPPVSRNENEEQDQGDSQTDNVRKFSF